MKYVSPSFRRRSILAVFIFWLVLGVTARGTSRGLLPKEREQVFEKVWKDGEEHYYDPEFGGVNWQGIRERYLPLVQAAKDDKDFYSIVDRMTAELHDAHTRFSSPEQWEDRKKHQGVSIGFRAGYVESKVVVLDVFPDSNAAYAGIEPGMIVTALGGEPIAGRLAESATKVLPSSTERVTQLRILSNAFAGTIETPFAGSFQRADGSVL